MRCHFGIIDKFEVDKIVDFCKNYAIYLNELCSDDEAVEKVLELRGEKVNRYHFRFKRNLFGFYFFVIDVDMQHMILDKYYIAVKYSAQYIEEGEMSFTFTSKEFAPKDFQSFLNIIDNDKHENDIINMFNDIVEVDGLKDNEMGNDPKDE